MVTEIRQVNKEDVWELRHKVMWPNKEYDFIKLKDDDEGIHFGLFIEKNLISVISLFIKNDDAQFRKFATLQQEQGKGYGTALLDFILNEAESYGVKRIWCNARKNKADFYKKFGFVETNSTYIKEGKSFVIMEKYL